MSGFPASKTGIGAPSGPASGDLAGTYPSPTVATVGGASAASIAAEPAARAAADALLQTLANLSQNIVTDASSTTKYPSTKAVYDFAAIAVAGLMELKGNIDCSTNPNYPAALVGDTYYVTVAGKIGGASGVAVDIGDAIVCKADNAGGTQASVGSSWFILEHNLQGALLASNNLSDLISAATARTNLGLVDGASNNYLKLGNGGAEVTGNYTLTLADLNTGIRCNSGSPLTISVDATVFTGLSGNAFGLIPILNIGAGLVTIQALNGSTTLYPNPSTATLTVPQRATATVEIYSTSAATVNGST